MLKLPDYPTIFTMLRFRRFAIASADQLSDKALHVLILDVEEWGIFVSDN